MINKWIKYQDSQSELGPTLFLIQLIKERIFTPRISEEWIKMNKIRIVLNGLDYLELQYEIGKYLSWFLVTILPCFVRSVISDSLCSLWWGWELDWLELTMSLFTFWCYTSVHVGPCQGSGETELVWHIVVPCAHLHHALTEWLEPKHFTFYKITILITIFKSIYLFSTILKSILFNMFWFMTG